jgi:hypothetical protein
VGWLQASDLLACLVALLLLLVVVVRLEIYTKQFNTLARLISYDYELTYIHDFICDNMHPSIPPAASLQSPLLAPVACPSIACPSKQIT